MTYHIFYAQCKSIQTTVIVCKLDTVYDRITVKLQTYSNNYSAKVFLIIEGLVSDF